MCRQPMSHEPSFFCQGSAERPGSRRLRQRVGCYELRTVEVLMHRVSHAALRRKKRDPKPLRDVARPFPHAAAVHMPLHKPEPHTATTGGSTGPRAASAGSTSDVQLLTPLTLARHPPLEPTSKTHSDVDPYTLHTANARICSAFRVIENQE
jgi:hypothetical protein